MPIELHITFDITATVHQVITITEPEYDEARILAGLRAGTIVTTTWHNQGESGEDGNPQALALFDNQADKQIGFVRSQTVDGDYEDFR